MTERLILLAGWAWGTAPLRPLAEALEAGNPRLRVQVQALPEQAHSDPVRWLDTLDEHLPGDTWLGGWSLGGQLASELAARRGARCPGLLTLASNPCFRMREAGDGGMPAEVFDAFRHGCASAPGATLKRFASLCAQGASDARGLSRTLLDGAPPTSSANLLAGLDVLAAVDTREALRRYHGPRLHLFAEFDALVPVTASLALQAQCPAARIRPIRRACHAFPLQFPGETAALIRAGLTHD